MVVRISALSAVLALLLATSPAHAALYTFSSADMVGFSPTLVLTEGSAVLIPQAAGGNPGPFVVVQQQVDAGTPASPADVAYFFDSGQSFDPGALGAIARMDFFMDTRLYFGGFGDGTRAGIALSQNGNVYFGPSFLANSSGVWTSQQVLNILASAFALAAGGTLDYTQHPDFSATGGPLQLGFLTWNTSVGDTYLIQSGYDNWRIDITTVPEPALGALLIAAALGGVALRRRRPAAA